MAVKGISHEMFIFLRLFWVQGLRLCLPPVGTVGSIPGQRVKIPQRNQNKEAII